MKKIKITETYEFDDVLIKPILSNVSSRDDVDISVKLSDYLTLQFPLIASPMVGVVDGAFAKKLSDLGGLAILHRFYKERILLYRDIQNNLDITKDKFGMSVKVDENNFEEIVSYNPSILLVDTANGYTKKLAQYCEKIKNYISQTSYHTLLMAGNVSTFLGCKALHEAGCDLIRIGIGGGSPCSTRNQTGIGIPNISAIIDCDNDEDDIPIYTREFKLVIDGGLKNSGDFVKAIIAGADLGMAGKLFAECYEAPNEGILYGMASRTHMENMKLPIKSVEGFDIPITKKQSLEQFVREFGYGIKSAGTYLNSRSLNEIYVNGEFVKVTNTAIKKGI